MKHQLRELEIHFKGGGWPITLDSITFTQDAAIKIAAAYISKHPKAVIYWAPLRYIPNSAPVLFISKWPIKRTLRYHCVDYYKAISRFPRRRRGLRLDNVKSRA